MYFDRSGTIPGRESNYRTYLYICVLQDLFCEGDRVRFYADGGDVVSFGEETTIGDFGVRQGWMEQGMIDHFSQVVKGHFDCGHYGCRRGFS